MTTSAYLVTWLRNGLTFRARVRDFGTEMHAASIVLMPGDTLLGIRILEP